MMEARLYLLLVLAAMAGRGLAKSSRKKYCTTVSTGYKDNKDGFDIHMGTAMFTNEHSEWNVEFNPNIKRSCPYGKHTGTAITVCDLGKRPKVEFTSKSSAFVKRSPGYKGHASGVVMVYCSSAGLKHLRSIQADSVLEKLYVWPEGVWDDNTASIDH